MNEKADLVLIVFLVLLVAGLALVPMAGIIDGILMERSYAI